MQRILSIHWASKYGLLWRVRILLKKDPEAVNKTDKEGKTPLDYAIDQGQKAVCELLLTYGANVNGSDLPPLWRAAWKGHVSIVELLLKQGAKVNAATSGSMETALHRAVYHGHYNVAKLSVEAGANINAKDAMSMAPLDEALGQKSPFGLEHIRPRNQHMVELLSTEKEELYHKKNTTNKSNIKVQRKNPSARESDEESIERQFLHAAQYRDVVSFMHIWGNRDLAREAAETIAQYAPDFLRDLAKLMTNSKADIVYRGHAAHVIMRVVAMNPAFGEIAGLWTALQEASYSSDFFVSGNAKHTLELIARHKK